MSRALRDINVGIAIMCGVASGYYIFDPVVRAAGEEYTQKKAEELEISEAVREPIETIHAQVNGLPLPQQDVKTGQASAAAHVNKN